MKILTLAFILLLTPFCFSQEKDKDEENDTLHYEIQELTITGTRTQKKIIDIPYSVFRVDKKELSYGKKVSAKDLLQDVPGLFLQSRYGNHDIRISIRGFGTRSNSGVRGVRILQDGIPESEADGEASVDAIDFTSLGGVEVVKGNLSSLYANAPGGVINFMTDLYYPKSYVSLTNQGGDFGYRQNGLKMGLKTNSYRYFLSYYYRNIDGFRKHSSEYQHLVNSVFEGYLGTNTVLTVLGNFTRFLNKLPGSLTEEQYNTDPFQARDLAVSQDFRTDTKKGRIGLKFKTNWGKNEKNELEVTGYGGLKDLIQTDDVSYVLSTRYYLGSFLRFTNSSKLFKHNNDITAGMDYAYQTGPRTEFDNINGNKGLTVQNQYDESIGNIGFYLQNQFSLINDKMELYLSGRYDRFIFSNKALQFRGNIDTSRVFEEFTPKAALNYKLTPNVALYTSYGIGFDIPSSNELENYPFSSNQGRTLLNPDLSAQKTNNFEFGIKGNVVRPKEEFFRKAFFEVTFFNYLLKDEIVPFIINNTSFFRNAAKSNRLGVEVGFKSEIFEETDLIINYVYTNFKYKEYTARVYDPSGNYVDYNFADNTEPSFPQHITNFILEKEFEITDDISCLLQFDCDYITKMYVDDKNSQSTGDYFTSNPMIGFHGKFKHINVLGYIGATNVFDRRYVSYININDYFGRYFNVGEPRNVYGGLNIGYNF